MDALSEGTESTPPNPEGRGGAGGPSAREIRSRILPLGQQPWGRCPRPDLQHLGLGPPLGVGEGEALCSLAGVVRAAGVCQEEEQVGPPSCPSSSPIAPIHTVCMSPGWLRPRRKVGFGPGSSLPSRTLSPQAIRTRPQHLLSYKKEQRPPPHTHLQGRPAPMAGPTRLRPGKDEPQSRKASRGDPVFPPRGTRWPLHPGPPTSTPHTPSSPGASAGPQVPPRLGRGPQVQGTHPVKHRTQFSFTHSLLLSQVIILKIF